MPTIEFNFNDFEKLIGKKITKEKFEELLPYVKAELESFENNKVKISLNDTNFPLLWTVEGLAIMFKALLGLKKGIPELKIKKTSNKIFVDKKLKRIRPYIVAFIARDGLITEELLKQLIQAQEKIAESYGRKRRKVAIGIYSADKIKFPINYVAADPEKYSFVPLDFDVELNLKEILENHPKGKEYGFILEGFTKYPLLIDSANNILSFPPIINSNYSGKVMPNDRNIFFEATGDDLNALLLVANIFALIFQERGFSIHSVIIDYGKEKIEVPKIKKEKRKINEKDVEDLLGIKLSKKEIKRLLERYCYACDENLNVTIPYFRDDILHEVDIIEDIAIVYGYENIGEEELNFYSKGNTFEINSFAEKIREILIGHGFQEVYSAILSNKELLYEKMNIPELETVEIKEYISASYSCLRTWLLPILMDVLAKNKHVSYPHKIFEEGLCCIKKGREIKDIRRVAAVIADEDADYTKIRQVFDSLMHLLGINYEIIETEHNSFIPGRVARIIVNDKKVAYIGEVHPKVLNNFNLEVPVAAFELNISDLFDAINKK